MVYLVFWNILVEYIAAICLAEEVDFQRQFSEDSPKIVLWTKGMHVEIHYFHILIQYFHISENLSVDVMHDILEGAGRYELKLLLQHLRTKHLTNKLYMWIQGFNYGFMERNNRQWSYFRVTVIWASISLSLGVYYAIHHLSLVTWFVQMINTGIFCFFFASNSQHCIFSSFQMVLKSIWSTWLHNTTHC